MDELRSHPNNKLFYTFNKKITFCVGEQENPAVIGNNLPSLSSMPIGFLQNLVFFCKEIKNYFVF